MKMLAILLVSAIAVVRPAESDSKGSFSYPPGCTRYCYYRAEWKHNDYDDTIDFTVSAKVSSGYWAGIGFSRNREMVDSDAYTAYSSDYGRNLNFHDRYLFAMRSNRVPADEKQSAKLTQHNQYEGRLTFSFRRKRNTGDPRDVSLTKCAYFLFAWGGKGLGGSRITKHSNAIVSKDQICIGAPEIASAGNYMPSHGQPSNFTKSFRHPPGCRDGYCEYKAEWDDDEYYAYFTISAKLGKGYWAGIGFSDDQMMPDSDSVTGYVPRSGPAFVLQDRYLLARRPDSVPPDSQQDAKTLSYSHYNGMLKFKFKRKKVTGDKRDKTLDVCRFLFFAWGGEAKEGGIITVHAKKFVSRNKICLGRGTGYGVSGYPAATPGQGPGYGVSGYPAATPGRGPGYGVSGYPAATPGRGPGYGVSGYPAETPGRGPGYGVSGYPAASPGRGPGYGVSGYPAATPGYGQRGDSCNDYDCGDNAYCQHTDGGRDCYCHGGYYKKDGRCYKGYLRSDKCYGHDCGDHGYCKYESGKHNCYCHGGYYRKNERCYLGYEKTSPCYSHDCGNNAYCMHHGGQNKCYCNTGYYRRGGRCCQRRGRGSGYGGDSRAVSGYGTDYAGGSNYHDRRPGYGGDSRYLDTRSGYDSKDKCYSYHCGSNAYCKHHDGRNHCYCKEGFYNKGGSCHSRKGQLAGFTTSDGTSRHGW